MATVDLSDARGCLGIGLSMNLCLVLVGHAGRLKNELQGPESRLRWGDAGDLRAADWLTVDAIT